MGSLLIVDGSGVCRAPVVAFALSSLLGSAFDAADVSVEARGIEASNGSTMCESAAARIGYSGPAIGFFGSYRAIRLSVADVARADLVLTAERAQRSAVVRMLPGTQASVFTWREALVLATVLADRRRLGTMPPVEHLAGLARALHGARGTVPLIEPAARTGPFHWRRVADADPLTIESGHRAQADHRRVTQESFEVAGLLASRMHDLLRTAPIRAATPEPAVRARRLRRSA